jgi:trk system potassium uptake protein TrkH
MQLYKAEVPGPVPEKLTPNVQQTALLLWRVYVLLSCLEVIALFAGGMTFYGLCSSEAVRVLPVEG